jgi:hypothetical protein
MTNRFLLAGFTCALIAASTAAHAAPLLTSDSRLAEAIRQMSPPNSADGSVTETLTDAQPHAQFKIVSASAFGFNASSRADVTSAYLPAGPAVSPGGPFGGFAISAGEVRSTATATSVGNTALSRATWEVNTIFTADTPVQYTFAGDRRATLTGVGAALDYRAELRNDSTGGTLVFQELGGGAFAYTTPFTGTIPAGTYHLRIRAAAQNFFATGDPLGTGTADILLSDVQLTLTSVPEPGTAGTLAAAATCIVARRRRRPA